MIQLIEPNRGEQMVKVLYSIMSNSDILSKLVPILADIFVFTYPVYLLSIYGLGMIQKDIEKKLAAIMIGANVFFSIVANIIIQFFVHKDRPNITLGLAENHETVLHKYLPSSSFPSDHAAVSMSIAIASIIRGILYKEKTYIRYGIVLVIFSIIMCISRITTAVHRPTDIIGGMLIGIIVPLIISIPKIHQLGRKISSWIAKYI